MALTPKFAGRVENGRITFHKPREVSAYLSKLGDNEIEVSIEKWKDQRSMQQNRYYWSVVVKIISNDTGNDPETVHEFLKAKFLTKRETIIKGEKQTTWAMQNGGALPHPCKI